MTNKEIAKLVERVQKKEKGAFEALYNTVLKTVYYRCLKNLGNEQDANDATQNVFINLYNGLNDLKHPNVFNKFMYKTIDYACLNLRKKKSHDVADELEAYESMAEDNAEFLPDAAYEREDIREQIAKMIETLPQKQRDAILFFYYDDVPIKQIAEIMDSEVGTVKANLFKARKTLRERAEALIKEGALNYTMAIVPIPILTRILLEEANRVVTPEVCETIWQGVCAGLGIAATATAGTVAAEAATTATTTTTTTAATTGIFTNLAIVATCASMLVVGVFIGYQVNENFMNPPPAIVETYNEDAITDILDLIRGITNRVEFTEFVEEFGFTLLGASFGEVNQRLYYLEQFERFIYLGYIETAQGEFRVVYEAAENRIPLTDVEIEAWFNRS